MDKKKEAKSMLALESKRIEDLKVQVKSYVHYSIS